jgi:hypothetical protein
VFAVSAPHSFLAVADVRASKGQSLRTPTVNLLPSHRSHVTL